MFWVDLDYSSNLYESLTHGAEQIIWLQYKSSSYNISQS